MNLRIFLCLMLCLGTLTACTSEPTTAMVDTAGILNSNPHAQEAAKHVQEAQAIFQYNLNVIEAKLSQYKNKELAQAVLAEATKQLQAQFDGTRGQVTQALLNALNTALEDQKKRYDLIIKTDGVIYVSEGDLTDKFKSMPEDITAKVQAIYASTKVTYPTLPMKVDNPELPADINPAEAPTEEKVEEKVEEKAEEKAEEKIEEEKKDENKQ